MRNFNCLVCKRECFGRNNQVFCSPECKNKHHNAQTRLIYSAGKHEKDEIRHVQAQIYANNDKIRKINDVFDQEVARKNSEYAILKSDYSDLLEKYIKIKAELEKIRSRYYDSFQSMQKVDEQIKLLACLAQIVSPAIEKITENMGKMKPDNG